MVRYAEIFLKSPPVRQHFEHLLMRNITRALASAGLPSDIRLPRGRILVRTQDPERAAAIVARVFGITDVSACRVAATSREAMVPAVSAYAAERMPLGSRFAVRARREGVEGYSSQEIAAEIGAAILDARPDARVDLSTPAYEVHVEARPFGALFYDSRLAGPGGIPCGTQGKVIVLLSAGIDSPVASWLLLRRGCEVTHLTLDAGCYSGSGVRERVLNNHRALSLWCPGTDLRLIRVPAEPIFSLLGSAPDRRLTCILCKRAMISIASSLMEGEGAHAIATGENLGQVASQTLRNLAVITDATRATLLRPLITWDKEEIVRKAREIGSFQPGPADLCCRVVPRHPAIAAKLPDVVHMEERLAINRVLTDVLAGREVITARDGRIGVEK